MKSRKNQPPRRARSPRPESPHAASLPVLQGRSPSPQRSSTPITPAHIQAPKSPVESQTAAPAQAHASASQQPTKSVDGFDRVTKRIEQEEDLSRLQLQHEKEEDLSRLRIQSAAFDQVPAMKQAETQARAQLEGQERASAFRNMFVENAAIDRAQAVQEARFDKIQPLLLALSMELNRREKKGKTQKERAVTPSDRQVSTLVQKTPDFVLSEQGEYPVFERERTVTWGSPGPHTISPDTHPMFGRYFEELVSYQALVISKITDVKSITDTDKFSTEELASLQGILEALHYFYTDFYVAVSQLDAALIQLEPAQSSMQSVTKIDYESRLIALSHNPATAHAALELGDEVLRASDKAFKKITAVTEEHAHSKYPRIAAVREVLVSMINALFESFKRLCKALNIGQNSAFLKRPFLVEPSVSVVGEWVGKTHTETLGTMNSLFHKKPPEQMNKRPEEDLDGTTSKPQDK